MSENEKANALLDEEQQEGSGENQENDEENKGQERRIDHAEQLRKSCKGTLKLAFPFKAADMDVEELPFDFCALSGAEIAAALDSVMGNIVVNNIYIISNEQALAVFAKAAAKCAPIIERENGSRSKMYDEKDIKSRIGSIDAIKMVQVAKLFYNASIQEGSRNISNG